MANKIFLFIYIGFFALSFTGCVSSIDNERRAGFYLQIGLDNLAQKNFPEALTNLIQADKLSPNNPVILNALGAFYLEHGKYTTASEYSSKALRINPQYTEARNNLGRIYIAQGHYDKAIVEVRKALKDLTYPHPEKVRTNLGIAYLRKNQFARAKQHLQSALKINKDYCPAYSYYGQTLLKLKQYDDANAIFDRGIKVCQDSPEEVHYLSALSYYQTGKKEMALVRLKEVAKLYPTSEYAEKSRSLLKVIQQETP